MAAKYLKSLSKEGLNNFIDSIDTVLSDCDGVLWLEADSIPGSPEAVEKFKEMGKRFFYVTNNNTKSRQEFVEKCESLKYKATLEEIISTSYLAAVYLKEKEFKKKVYVVGTDGIGKELDSVGIRHSGIGPDLMNGSAVRLLSDFKPDPEIGAVLVGFDEHFSYPKMVKASTYLQDPGVLFIGTNGDTERPTPNNNRFPGSGCFIQAIEAAASRKAVVVGKPEAYVSRMLIAKYNLDPAKTLMIGDKGDTDILLGKRCGFKTLMVLSGVTTAKQIEQWQNSDKEEERILVPDYYTDQLSDIIPLLSSL